MYKIFILVGVIILVYMLAGYFSTKDIGFTSPSGYPGSTGNYTRMVTPMPVYGTTGAPSVYEDTTNGYPQGFWETFNEEGGYPEDQEKENFAW